MCVDNKLQVDNARTIRFYKQLHVVLEYPNNYFGSMATDLVSPTEHGKQRKIQATFAGLHQFKQTLIHEDEGEP